MIPWLPSSRRFECHHRLSLSFDLNLGDFGIFTLKKNLERVRMECDFRRAALRTIDRIVRRGRIGSDN